MMSQVIVVLSSHIPSSCQGTQLLNSSSVQTRDILGEVIVKN